MSDLSIKKEQKKVFEESKCKLKLGDKVKHKASSEFDMVVIDFEIYWRNDEARVMDGIKNPDRPICRYYDTYKKEWVSFPFLCHELVAIEDN